MKSHPSTLVSSTPPRSRLLIRLRRAVQAGILALAAVTVAHAQFQWSAYNTSGALVGTAGAAGTFDAATEAYTFTVPAGQAYTFVTTNFAPVTMSAPASGTTIKTISYKMRSSAGWTGVAASNRVNNIGLFDTSSTAPDATGNFTDDVGLWANFKGGTWSNEVFGGVSPNANLIGPYNSGQKLGSGKTAGTNTAWTLTDNELIDVTFRIALTSGGTFSIGTSSSYANAGLLVEDSAAAGDGTSYQAIYSGGATAVTAPRSFNEYAFYFYNTAATDSTITLSAISGLVPPPYFTTVTGQPPSTLAATLGQNVSIPSSVPASLTGVTYQWQKSTDSGTTYTDISSAGNASAATNTLELTNVQASDAALYRVVITNSAGTATSSACTLSVGSSVVAPAILTDPQAASILVGGSNMFAVSASGTTPLTYQWSKSTDSGANYTDIPGATDATYTLSNAVLADTALYRVTVTNSAGTATSAAAALTVNQSPAITAQPVGATLNAGDNLTLTVAATGTPAPTYQWKLNGADLPGATTAAYTITGATSADTGNYTVVVTNSVGAVASSPASVAVVSTSFTASTFGPANAATAVLPDAPLTITFSQPVAAGVSGFLRVRDASDDSVVDTIDLVTATALRDSIRGGNALSARLLPVQTKSIGGQSNFNYYPIAVSGNTATIYPRDGSLAYGKTYYVTVDAGVFTDTSGGAFAGVSDPNAWRFTTKASAPELDALITVAADGSGDFATLQGAIDFIPAGNTTPRTISIKNGTYFEIIYFTGKHFLTFLGESAAGTVIDYPNNNTFNSAGGVYHRGTFYGNNVHDVTLANFTVRNSTPQNGTQAEAIILTGSATSGHNLLSGLKLYSYQDTLQLNGQCYVADSYIEGDVDFLWGNGPSFFRNCDIKILRTGGYFAQVRNGSGNHGFVFHNCRFTAAAGITGTFFNRIDPNSSQYPSSEMVLLDSIIGDATNNNFLNTNVGTSGANFQTGWWLLNNVAADVATIHHWDNNSLDKDGAAATFASRPASTIMPADATTQANYRDAYWVLNTARDGTATAGTWTPALAPLFLTHPADTSATVGSSVTLTATTTAIPAATYQWKKDGVDLTGATAASYTVASAATGDSGIYTVVATNASGSSTSNPAIVSIGGTAVAPAITTQPASQNVIAGTDVTFTVAAIGTAPFTYQWKKNGADISGATSASLALSSTLTIDSGAYTVVVTNSAGSVTSNAATLVVNGTSGLSAPDGFAASVTGGSAGPTVTVTTAAALKQYAEAPATSPYVIVVSGTIDLGTDGRIKVTSNKTIKGENTAATVLGTLTISNATNVIVSNLNVSANTGDPATNDGITIAASTYVLVTKCTIYDCTDGNLDVINGSDFVTVSWCKFYYTRNNGHNFSNLIGSSDTDTGVGGQYRVTWHHNWWSTGAKQRMLACRFGGAHMFNNYWSCAGNDYCTEVRLNAEMLSEHNYYDGVKDPLAKRDALPTDQGKLKTIDNLFNNCTGTQLVSNDDVFTPPYSYPLAATADIPALVMAGAGNVAVDAPASVGSATISGATSVTTGASLTLTAAPVGFTPASYQWRYKNAAISGATTATLTLASAQSTDAGDYTVVLGLSGGGSVVSAPLTLAVTDAPAAPTIATQPSSLTVTAGASASFNVTATGTGLTYQWKKDNADIAGATDATYTIATAAQADAGSYTVVVTNSTDSVTSNAATLTVAPVFTAPVASGYGGAATGGGSATQVVVNNADDFRTQAESSSAAVITVSGTLNLGTSKVAVKSNKTLQGIDANATLVGNLELASGVSNVVIRGLNLTNPGSPGGDGLTLNGATNVFVTHVTFFDCADTLLRVVGGADNITVSWCEFYYTSAQTAHRYATLIGATTGETKALRVTLDHNWYSDRIDQQLPDSTWGQLHLYNNYFNPNGIANTTGSIARANAQFLSERNQYTDIVSPLTKTAGGLVRAIGNVYTGTSGTAADAGTDAVFTPSYSYHLHATADLPAFLLAGAGNTAGAASATLPAGAVSINASATSVTAGSAFTLTSVTTLSAVTGWQWRLNNTDIAGATNATYTVSSAQSANAGVYTVVAMNAAGEAIVSTPTTLSVTAAPVTPPEPPRSSSGGGGAPSAGFFISLALLLVLRAKKRSIQ